MHFEWTLGKKSPVLKRVDKAAKAAATRGGPDIDRGYKPGAIARSMVKGAATRFPAKGQSAVIRPYRKNLLGDGEEKIRVAEHCHSAFLGVHSCRQSSWRVYKCVSISADHF